MLVLALTCMWLAAMVKKRCLAGLGQYWWQHQCERRKEGAMGVMVWLAIGVVIGILTLVIEPYVNRRHIVITLVFGILGALAGGAIGSFVGFGKVDGMHFMILVLSVAGAVFFLSLYRFFENA